MVNSIFSLITETRKEQRFQGVIYTLQHHAQADVYRSCYTHIFFCFTSGKYKFQTSLCHPG